jgi:hypothetical protein
MYSTGNLFHPWDEKQQYSGQVANKADGGTKKNTPAPNYQQINDQQNAANKPNQLGDFSSVTWTTDPATGLPVQHTGLGGPLAGAAQNVAGQAAGQLGQPLDLSGLPQLDYGQAAYDKAANASYGQAVSRLDPQWNQRQEALRTQLLNQGLDPSSEAYKSAESEFSNQRNDAYGSAMNAAQGIGLQAGNQMFQQSALARQNALAELLQQRGLPLDEIMKLQGIATGGRSGFNQSTGALDAARYGYEADAANLDRQRQWMADLLGAGGKLGGMITGLPLGGGGGGAVSGAAAPSAMTAASSFVPRSY